MSALAFEKLARQHGADFREVVLLDEREVAIERFNRRVQDSDDSWIRHSTVSSSWAGLADALR